VALSADSEEETVARCLAAGCDAHVAKPVSCADLLELLDDLISNRNTASAPGDAQPRT
jgi:CheY-like chemotaxis protein